jgi:hypothetical protein
MSAPAAVPVAITVQANLEADRVVYTFGDQSFGLKVEDVALLMSHSMAALDILRPHGASGTVQ